MPLSLSDLASIRSNNQFSDFSARVEQAVRNHARYILVSAASPSADEVAWAKRVWQAPGSIKDEVTRFVINDNAGMADVATLVAMDDATIEASVQAYATNVVAPSA
jgi:hypothetical protein